MIELNRILIRSNGVKIKHYNPLLLLYIVVVRFLTMYYQEKVINGILCCKYSPNGEWIELAKQTLTERLMKYEKALQIIQNFDEEDEGKYGDPGVVAGEALSF
jgi:hypothetical protein